MLGLNISYCAMMKEMFGMGRTLGKCSSRDVFYIIIDSYTLLQYAYIIPCINPLWMQEDGADT